MSPVNPSSIPLVDDLTGAAHNVANYATNFVSAHKWNVGIWSVIFLITIVLLEITVLRQRRSSFANIDGPPRGHWFLGNLSTIMDLSPSEIQWGMSRMYGETYRTHAVAGEMMLTSGDIKLVNYLLLHPDMWIKPPGPNVLLTNALGKGLVTVEGAVHRRQRRVVNPAFGWIQVQAMTPMIFTKAHELRHRLHEMIETTTNENPKDPDHVAGAIKIDVLRPLSDASLDIIGLVGFGEDLHALSAEPNVLREAYTAAINAAFELDAVALLQLGGINWAGWIPTKRQRVLESVRKTSQRVGGVIVEEKKRLIADLYEGKIEKSTDIGKDVLSLLIKANMAPDLREDQRMNDTELMDQISTVLFAGHETTGTALMWCLYRLALNPAIQERLREELLTVESEEPSFEELHALPYLDKVIHESLRLESPIPLTIRVATRSGVLPLETPIKGRDGTYIESIPFKKGDQILIPIAAMNTSASIWGEDALEFKPERWEKEHSHIPGVWGNMMTFIGGPRNCIGHRLTICEMKVVLFVLFRHFAWEIPPSEPKLKRTWLVIQRALVIGQEDAGPQLPLMVRPL